MSAGSHRTDYIILGTIGVLVAAVLLLLTAAGPEEEEGGVRQWFRTTHSTNIEGTLIYYTLLDRLGVPVHRSARPLVLENLEDIDVLFLMDPMMPVWGDEESGLTQWVRKGGVLVCSGAGARALEDARDVQVLHDGGGERGEPRRHPPAEQPMTTVVQRDASGLPLARDVAAVQFETKATLAVDEFAPGRAGAAEPLLKDEIGTRAVTYRAGAGRVVVLAETSFLANRWIGKADNAIAAVNLAYYALSRAHGKRVAFDEYHFGYGAGESGFSVMSALLLKTSPGWAVLSLTAAGVLFLIYKGRRFGTRRAPQSGRRRSKLEYVHSVGATYAAAGAHRLTFRLIFQWFRRRAAERAAVPSSATSHEIAAGLARRGKGSVEHYEEPLAQCEEALAAPWMSSQRLSDLLSRLARIESETFDARARGK